ncbi:MAG: type I DNA topoisomerase [Candidatus Marinimicrobia bacterium]|jgi:DNA topoisomerase-1|nr:type I DNA topoisomerase [Candidatus Neomarinimicrobiota bacterium]MBT3633112.1 type I DNA topoisomerase [Candidatus Neomarinimicrobiota bacterium]MBT3682287.1 type I DNA topoisomerase [Candidatus Neomarinimicrobiota bacterium]MBT3758712.1 type I DNA topoisomerase [Candidatus Neomarinimicrobiota bacterium]MBT3895414.1 type I DNA topoisomerase [Candidatus Neomarinimicrobiota bacterium]
MNTKSNNLIIVESPSKARTLKKFLGDQYIVEASVGHVRDLPSNELGIDVDNGFTPKYIVSTDKKKVVSAMKKALVGAESIYLATDPDREGEAIAWHLIQILKPKIPVKRLVFHEITKSAINEAFDHTREIDSNLVSAQETRRILDRLFGFQVSEKLWYNIKTRLSAGRVQSPAIKIIVDREKLRSAFIKNEYWRITGNFNGNSEDFSTILIEIDDKKIARGKDFNKTTGKLTGSNKEILTKESAEKYIGEWKTHDWTVKSIVHKPVVSNPSPPFITSTLQQEGVRKLRLSSRQVMSTAQRLYEGGFITYMRTDSVNLSSEAIDAARTAIGNHYGNEYLPEKPRYYKNKVKNAQEAHEAIRPAGSNFRSPDELSSQLNDLELKLYSMIWKRTIASQMASAKLLQTTAHIWDNHAVFEAKGKTIRFYGYLKAYVTGSDDRNAARDDQESILPDMTQNQSILCNDLIPSGHFTKPAPRYTEASLVKEMESRGIGRPSTYASIMELIQKRGYANKVKGALIPTFTAYAVVQFLERYFTDLVDLEFTARLEDQLDKISRSEMDASEFLSQYYFGGDGHPGLKAELELDFDKDVSRQILSLKDPDGNEILLKIGRYGLYLQSNGENLTLEDDFVPGDLTPQSISEMFKKKNTAPEILGSFPENGEDIHLINGRYGYYLKAGDKMKSLLPGMTEDMVTLEDAIQILSLPKSLGKWKDNEVKADLGRYGPYIRCGKETRKVAPPDNIIEITLERAGELLDAPAKRAGTQVLKVLGTDPATKTNIELKDGRYGAYVTDGKINATIPKSLSVDDVTLEQAIEMIKVKKAKGPAKHRFKKKKKS